MATETAQQLSAGYVALVKNGASDNQICDYLDKQLGVQYTQPPVITTGKISICNGVGFDSVSGKILGFTGPQGYSGPRQNPNRYCSLVTCADWQCQIHD